MNICDINPLIRFAAMTIFTPVAEFGYSYDSRLFYVVEGSGTLIIDGKTYTLSPNDLSIWKCGNKYRFCNYNNLKMIAINFDFTQIHNDCTESIRPVLAKNFDPSLLMETECFSD